jgi:hypothetical protein
MRFPGEILSNLVASGRQVCRLTLLSSAFLLRNNFACRPNLEPPIALQSAWMLDSGVPDEGFQWGAAADKNTTAPRCALFCMLLAADLLHNHGPCLPNLE